MITRGDIIARAARAIGTPFVHQGRIIGKGLDCFGLVVAVGKSLGVMDHDCKTYDRYVEGDKVLTEMRKGLDQIEIADAGPGDVVVMCVTRARTARHIGILSDCNNIIHTNHTTGEIVETSYKPQWARATVAAFKYKGID